MRAQHGVVLLEYLIAAFLLAIVVVGVLNLLSVGYLSAGMAQHFNLATSLAQGRLEEVKAAGCDAAVSVPREPVDTVRFPGYDWEVEVTERASGLAEARTTVYWRDGRTERHVTLVTLLRKTR